MNRRPPNQPTGIILLVVISSLAFFSILIATYLIYSRDARQSSFVLASRNYRAPDIKDLLDEALMMQVRGTDDPYSPFFGQDLLSDYYGRKDALELRVRRQNTVSGASFRHVGGGYIRVPVQWGTGATPGPRPFDPVTLQRDDLFTGRLVTFTAGPLSNYTHRVVRSRVVANVPDWNNQPEFADILYIQLDPAVVPSNVNFAGDQDQLVASLSPLSRLFYDGGVTNAAGFTIHMNGLPRNSPGIGFDGTSVDMNLSDMRTGIFAPPPVAPGGAPLGVDDLPVALQPNTIRQIETIDKRQLLGQYNPGTNSFGFNRGDFDEDYDAADFNNWFLSYQNPDVYHPQEDLGNGNIVPEKIVPGTIVPSFHRPAVINYILNQVSWSSATSDQYRQVLASISRATFRPLPIAPGQFGNALGINHEFTGSNTKYALRAPLFTAAVLPPNTNPGMPAQRRLDQLARALVADNTDALNLNQWDVDNSGDGQKDSIWIDLDLPAITSSEGKLLKPLVATRIEDLSGRLNVNAHSNPQLAVDAAHLATEYASWAGTRGVFSNAANVRDVFRGLGYGPAEIGIPAVHARGPLTTTEATALSSIVADRYASRYGASVAGRPGGDPLDVLRTGSRPRRMTSGGGYGYSIDPFGRGGVAMGRSGHLLAAVSGTVITASANPADRVDEALNDPYEMDPTGELGGDIPYSFAELEPLLRASEFDIDLLPSRLRGRLASLLEAYPEFARVFTTHSKSDDTLIDATVIDPTMPKASAYVKLLQRISAEGGAGLSAAQINELIAPELRLGRKLDINRPFGNGVDDLRTGAVSTDPGYGTVDEPREIPPGIWLPIRPNTPLQSGAYNASTLFNGVVESTAFAVSPSSDQAVPTGMQVPPRYDFLEVDTYTGSPPLAIFELGNPAMGRQVTSRQLMARHLYVLMMLLTREYTDFPSMATVIDLPEPTPTPPSFNPAFFKARRIAQWAVNVVDYRDNDTIMTRFVFDDNPFDGWNPPAENDPDLARHVVWGVESPDLVFSESLALHDVRVRDTDRDGGSGKTTDEAVDPDPHTDQVRRPEGSLFLELYCPQPQFVVNPTNPMLIGDPEQSTKPGIHRELYSIDPDNGMSWVLDLNRTAPRNPNAGSGPGVPVWRIAISERHDVGSAKENANPLRLREAFPNSYSFDPQHSDELDSSPLPTDQQLEFDRYIWFHHFESREDIEDLINDNGIRGNGLALMGRDQVFFAPNSDAREIKQLNPPLRQLRPGQYLAIAPRELTYLGSRREAGLYPGQPSAQRFAVSSVSGQEGVIHYNHASNPADLTVGRLTPTLNATTAHHTAARPLIIGAFPPTGATSWGVDSFEDGFIGLNVSEPLADKYYPSPGTAHRLNSVNTPAGDAFPLTDAFLDYNQAATLARDVPVDIDTDLALAFGRIPTFDAVADRQEPLLGTLAEYCTAFLQRLADPTVPYDPVFNPYRTIDSITIDLTVFSGEEDPDTVNPGRGATAVYAHRSRQRNGHINDQPHNALFSYETNAPFADEPAGIAPTATEDFFALSLPDQHLYNSLSFLNTDTSRSAPGGSPLPAAQARLNPAPFVGFAPSIGSGGAANSGVTGTERNLPAVLTNGDPSGPFALHPWLNRPLASHFELMMVPACSQGRLFEEFSFNHAGGTPKIYPTAPTDPLNSPAVDPVTFYGAFTHLLNFFHSGRPGTGGAGPDAANFARILSFVHTLPRFKGEVEVIAPSRLNLAGNNPGDAQSNDPFFRALLRPPFNLDYDNQRIGRVNLNTVSEFPVWAGLMQGHLTGAEFTNPSAGVTADMLSYQRFLNGRRGFTVPPPVPVPQPVTIMDGGNINYDPSNLSHQFPTQFVGVYRDALAATFAPALREVTSPPPLAPDRLRRREADATLLRSEPIGTPPELVPRWVRNQAGTVLPHLDRNRNAFTRYQTLMRMPNLVTDNSQLYMIRMTVGFFEVDASTGSLGREYNEDLGQNKRYRAMYIIDRAKEVGFIPGQNLNARDVVLFESYTQ